MAKYILKAIDDSADEMAATVTYEFESDTADNLTWHLAQFMRAAGYTWIENLDIIKDNFEDDEFNQFDDSELVEDDSMIVNKDSANNRDTK